MFKYFMHLEDHWRFRTPHPYMHDIFTFFFLIFSLAFGGTLEVMIPYPCSDVWQTWIIHTHKKRDESEQHRMFLKVQMPWNVIIPADSLDAKGLMLKKAIVIRLMDEFACKKASKDLGYFMAVTTLESIGEGRVRQNTGDVLFPVVFSGITFKMYRGEILQGVVHKILKHGVFLRCGPVQNIYLSHIKMPDYHYVPGENGIFMNDKHSKIDKDVIVRFIVIGTKWMEAEREYQALVSLEGDYLGPVS